MNISFVFPGFLFAISLIAIPIIVHLFNFRRFKKVYFTNVKFLKELKEETTSRSKLKHLLVLLSRILAVIFLVLAFAQPYIPAAQGTKIAANRVVSVFVDNSFSMEAVTRDGTLLDVARKKAKEIAAAYQPSDRFQLLTNDFDPVHQRLLGREEFINEVDLVKISPASRKLSDILTRQIDVLNNSGSEERSSVLISDFQESMADLNALPQDSLISVSLVPVNASELSNLYIDSVWFSSPVVQLQQPVELNVRIRNVGDLDQEAVPVKLTINDVQKAVAAAKVASGNYTDVKLTFTVSTVGWQRAVVGIIDNPITFDDQYYFSFNVAESANLLAINNSAPSPYLKALFNPEGYFKLANSDERQIDYSAFSRNKVIVLNELKSLSSGMVAELSRYVENGGTLVVVPDSSIDFNSYGDLFNKLGIPPFSSLVMNQERVDKLMLEDELFHGVFSSGSGVSSSTDLPQVEKYYLQNAASTGTGEKLIQLRSGAPLLSRFLKGKGEVYLFVVSFTEGMSNFARHALFVPVMYRMALLSEKSTKLSYFIGADDRIDLPATTIAGDEVFHLINEKSGFDIIPGHRNTGNGTVISINNQIEIAANYDLKLRDELVSVTAFNYNRAESQLKFRPAAELKSEIESLRLKNIKVIDSGDVELTRAFSSINEGTRLWKYCIILVLIFLAFEVLLLKFWKP